MTESPQNEILGLLALIAEQAGEHVSKTRLEFTVRCLSEHPAEKIISGLRRLALRARRFPTVADVLDASGLGEATDQDEAAKVAAKIVGAIRRHGSYNPDRARDAIGPIGWQVVQDEGGWEAICEVTNADLTNKQAHWRMRAQGVVARREWLSDDPKPRIGGRITYIADGEDEHA